MENKEKNKPVIAGVIFVGCFLIGLGVGILFHHTTVGLFIGLGVGFLSMGLVYAFYKG